jgi:hypothetical protein
VRDLVFEIDGYVPRYWHGGRRAVTLFFDGLSLFFPPGERFFIDSVRAFRDHIDDPELLARVRAFCGQEGVHSREHERYNAALEVRGLPARELEQAVVARLQDMTSRTDRRWQLAVTCALEHLTAIMADVALRDPEQLAGAAPVMAALWRWHAVEETEHKSVAFDVYQATGGGYRVRVTALALATLGFWLNAIGHQRRLMAADGCLDDWREHASLAWFLFGRPGGLRKIARPWLAYFRPGFHPDDHDSRELVEAWLRAAGAAPYDRRHPGAAA